MAHIYMSFDFGTDEEKAQLARHKLEMWKQAFRLDKKMLYKFERTALDGVAAGASGEEAGLKPGPTKSTEKSAEKSAEKNEGKKAGKSGKAAKSKEKAEPEKKAASTGNVKLHLRLAMPAHERITEERFLQKFPSEELFNSASPVLVRQGQPGFAEADAVFESLD
jgi:sRNA-binding protein